MTKIRASEVYEYEEFRAEVEETVEMIFSPITSSEQFARLAILSKLIYSGNAKSARFDEIFLQAYGYCLRKLMRTPTEEHYQLLKQIECHLCIDGGKRIIFNEVMARFEKALGKTPTPSSQKRSVIPGMPPNASDTSSQNEKSPERSQETILEEGEDIPSLEELEEKFFERSPSYDPYKTNQGVRKSLALLHAFYQNPETFESPDALMHQIRETLMSLTHPEEKSASQLRRVAAICWVLYAFRNEQHGDGDTILYNVYRMCLEELTRHPSWGSYLEFVQLRQCSLCVTGDERKFIEEQEDNMEQYLKDTGQWPGM